VTYLKVPPTLRNYIVPQRVLGETRARLVHAKAPWHELVTLRDVDTAEDARAEGLLT